MHFCADELAVLLLGVSSIPFIGIYAQRFASWLKAKKKAHCCCETHIDQEAA